MKLEILSKKGKRTYFDVVEMSVDKKEIFYAQELYAFPDSYSLDKVDLIKLDGETIYVSEEKLKEQEETLEQIINEYGSLGGFFEHCVKMVNGGLDETN